jgi:pyridoxamine 5'-phosphate oxidase
VELEEMRRAYGLGALRETDVDPDPVAQLRRWLADAVSFGVAEPNAMVLATTGGDGRPSARIVLLKQLDERGLVFYTNTESRKGAELAAEPHCALVFPWHAMERQVRVEGTAELVPRDEVDAYFATRPRESRLGAWASEQSRPVASRDELDRRYASYEQRWPEGTTIPAPPFWGGYRIRPEVVELWQGRTGRLHDRLRYRRTGDGWTLERLHP